MESIIQKIVEKLLHVRLQREELDAIEKQLLRAGNEIDATLLSKLLSRAMGDVNFKAPADRAPAPSDVPAVPPLPPGVTSRTELGRYVLAMFANGSTDPKDWKAWRYSDLLKMAKAQGIDREPRVLAYRPDGKPKDFSKQLQFILRTYVTSGIMKDITTKPYVVCLVRLPKTQE